MNDATMFDYSEDAESTATRVAETCLSPIAEHIEGSILNEAFCLDDSYDEHQAELVYLRDENARLRTTAQQLRIMNTVVSEALCKSKEQVAEAEASLEHLRDYTVRMEDKFQSIRDRAMDIILSRTAEVDRLKKELSDKRTAHVLSADALPFVPASKPHTLKDAIISRLKEKGYTPYTA